MDMSLHYRNVWLDANAMMLIPASTLHGKRAKSRYDLEIVADWLPGFCYRQPV